MSDRKDVRLVIRLSRELRDAANEKAQREDMTVSQVVRRCLVRWLAKDPPTGKEEEPQL